MVAVGYIGPILREMTARVVVSDTKAFMRGGFLCGDP